MQPTIVVQVLTVALNAVLSPVMIAGWITGRPLGILGAGLSTSTCVAVGVAPMYAYFARLESPFATTCCSAFSGLEPDLPVLAQATLIRLTRTVRHPELC